ncbi:MAG: hypothetical protein L3J15_02425 [Devosiaceae bacterium]|nr:hypothetical protein [Devosiaceae bacterium]
MNDLAFKIHRPIINTNDLEIIFLYSLGELNFEEKLFFQEEADLDILNSQSFERLVSLAACILGVSYYKLLAPYEIDASDLSLSQDEQKLVLDIYENGLGEFFARNNLKRYGKIKLSANINNQQKEKPLKLRSRILLPIGGGKDSLVSVQLLEKAKLDFMPFAVNPKGPIISSIEKIERQPIYVKRILDKEMIRLSQQPNYYNGHVPSTAINSIIATLCAVLYDYKYIALSNERSASEGNIEFDGREVNHQYSKSFDFEKMFNNVISDATGGELQYFSLLRPFSEVKIAKIFARENRFDRVFSSCNQNFKLAGHDGRLWCTNCPKCHFTFLILAPNMDKNRLNEIFGHNLLDVEKNENAYRELTGLKGHKPWECVGEILEAAAMIYALSKNEQYQNDIIVSKLSADIIDFYGTKKLQQALSDLMKDSNVHLIPKSIEQKVMPYAK